MKRGLFITLEGPDGSGKSTQIEEIKHFLEKKGEHVLITREPGGTQISEKIRQIILDRENKEMEPMTEAMLYAAARAQHVAQVIRPALKKGQHVICDRFLDSSIAYQGYGRGLGDCVSIINAYAVQECVPDITFLMKVSPEIAKARIGKEKQDRIEMEEMDFHSRVYFGYKELELQFPERIIGIDADREVEAIRDEILYHIERRLEKE